SPACRCRSPSPARSRPCPGREAAGIRPGRLPPPAARPATAEGSSTSARSGTGLAQRCEPSSNHLLLGPDHLALEHARANREQDAVADETEHGEAYDAGEHQVEPHPFLA